MKLFVVLAALLSVQAPSRAGMFQLTFAVPDLGNMRYALFLPDGYDPAVPRPLVLALHPGGERMPYYGGAFVRQVVGPALADLEAVIVAPDCPTRAWTDAVAERAVLALLRSVLGEYRIDEQRILVTGFSLGGRGTWHFSARHADLFTAAIPIAGSTGDEPAEGLARIPTYVIHSREDEVVPFAPAERTASELRARGRVVEFEAIEGVGHFQMGAYVGALERAGRWVSRQWAR